MPNRITGTPKKKKAFISGPMRGIPDWNAPMFEYAEKTYTSLGYEVFNPSWMKFGEGWDVNSIFAIDIAALAQCDCIIMLPGWEKSEGATLEHDYAKKTGKEFLYLSTPVKQEDIDNYLYHGIIPESTGG